MEVARTAGKRWARTVAGTVSVSVLALVGLTSAAPALAQVPAATANYSGYATGSDVHASALTTGSTTLADVEEAFSGSSVNSQGLSSNIVDSDLTDQPLVQAAAAGENSGGRGDGVEVGLVPPAPLTNQILLSQLATATAPPNSGLVDHSIPLNVDPVLEATLLEGKAQANWNTGGCVLGEPISMGFGQATNLGLVGTAAGTNPTGLVGSGGAANSTSSEVLIPQVNKAGNVVGNGTGLMSQVVENVAPVVIGNAVTITVVGPWELQAVATGVAGQSYVGFGPAPGPNQAAILNGTEPAITISTLAGIQDQITFQQILGGNGLSIPLAGLATISIAGPPRAIGGQPGTAPTISADGTTVSAAADLVQISVGIAGLSVTDLRVGHMVASATVPGGGLQCPIPVSKTASQQNVNPGDSFHYTITVSNPYNCTLSNVKVVDTTTASSGVRFTITGESPAANSNSNGVLTWNNIGSLAPGANSVLTVNVTISSGSGGGKLTEKAAVTGSCGVGNAQGTATVGLPLSGSQTVNVPTIGGGQGSALPVTGGLSGRYYAVALLIGLAALAAGRKGIMALLSSRN
ncbi:MAG: hypothetical protein ACRDJU_03170 [Actinomycetota bacterium]